MTPFAAIKIAGYTVPICWEVNLIANYERIGEYSPFEQSIRIATGLTPQERNETIIHEVLEAMNSIYDLNLNHDEQLCKLSVILHQVITDNPYFLGFLREERNETIIHEVLEVINSIYDLNLDHDEQLCKLSVILHQVITDNPDFLDFLREEGS